MKSFIKYIAVFCAGVLFTCLLVFTYSVVKNVKKDLLNPVFVNQDSEVVNETVVNKIELLTSYLDKYYLNEVDKKKMIESMYAGLVEGIGDPYTVYYTPEEYNAVTESSNGIYSGIGATLSQDAETKVITIVKLFKNSPAYQSGLLPGDKLVKVNGDEIGTDDINHVITKVKGKEGTKVQIEVAREGEKDLLKFSITRKTIEVPTVEYEMLDNKIGYILVTEFDQVTTEQYKQALNKLQKEGIKGLVVDLRNNPGGNLNVVVEMLDMMLPKGDIVSTKDKNGRGDKYTSDEEHQFRKPLAVLINGNSASASEIYAGAIKDYKLGTLVGTQTFGKGIVQGIFSNLGDGSAIKITISKYYTPNGKNIHDVGIEPDVKVELDKKLTQKLSFTKKEDNQLQKAIAILKQEVNK